MAERYTYDGGNPEHQAIRRKLFGGSSRETCDVCGGEGKVAVFHDPLGVVVPFVCPRCAGRGWRRPTSPE